MQLEVITGQYKTTKLREVQKYLHLQGIDVSIITGSLCTTPYFLIQLTQQAEAGVKHFLADDCTRQQIQAVLNLQQEENSGLPDDFIAHLVRQA